MRKKYSRILNINTKTILSMYGLPNFGHHIELLDVHGRINYLLKENQFGANIVYIKD